MWKKSNAWTLLKKGGDDMTRKESTPGISSQGLTEKDFQFMEELADREFAAFLQSTVVPQCKVETSPHEVEARRVTSEDIEEIRSAALGSQNQQMLAWACLMQEVLYIRELLEQQNQPCDGGNR